MEIFLKAITQKTRITTSKGVLSLEKIGEMSLSDLDAVAVELDEAYEKSRGKSFLSQRSRANEKLKFHRDLVVAILEYKAHAAREASEAKDNKQHNDKILTILAERQADALQNLPEAELRAMLK